MFDATMETGKGSRGQNRIGQKDETEQNTKQLERKQWNIISEIEPTLREKWASLSLSNFWVTPPEQKIPAISCFWSSTGNDR